ncbi:hypothetical protein D3C87_1213490 [compost metagenome]
MPQEITALDQIGCQVGQRHGFEVLLQTLLLSHRREVEYRKQLSARIKYRAGRTRQADVLATEMLITSDGYMLSLDQAGADTVGTLAILAPYRTKPQSGTLELGAFGFVEHTVDRHTAGIGE